MKGITRISKLLDWFDVKLIKFNGEIQLRLTEKEFQTEMDFYGKNMTEVATKAFAWWEKANGK